MDKYVTIWNRHKVKRMNECGHFLDNHVSIRSTFRSLNNFKGGGVILMTCMLMFHLVNKDTRFKSIKGEPRMEVTSR
jgi:hypothetical protein